MHTVRGVRYILKEVWIKACWKQNCDPKLSQWALPRLHIFLKTVQPWCTFYTGWQLISEVGLFSILYHKWICKMTRFFWHIGHMHNRDFCFEIYDGDRNMGQTIYAPKFQHITASDVERSINDFDHFSINTLYLFLKSFNTRSKDLSWIVWMHPISFQYHSNIIPISFLYHSNIMPLTTHANSEDST